MKLLFAHYRVGQTDGVSLEMDKWRRVLESMGHTCLYLAGNPSPVTDFVIDGMYYLGEENRAIVDNAYRGACTMDEAELRGRIYAAADEIAQRLIRIVRDNDIDVVIPNNIWSLGWHLPCAVAFTTAAEALPDVRFIGHNHDFYWERTLYSSPAYPFVREILATCCPPAGKNVRHAVINRIAQEELRRRRGIEATVVPNVYDFEARPWEKDAYNADLRARYGIGEDDIVLLQATRIGERKAIELAVRTIARMPAYLRTFAGRPLYDGRIYSGRKPVFVLAGMDESLGGGYFDRLKALMAELDVDYRYIGGDVAYSRGTADDGRKLYSLFDTYTMCDAVTYPSVLEGWGNQLLEAMFAKKPVLYYEYPVFKTDIRAAGFEGISLGGTYCERDGLADIDEPVFDTCAGALTNLLFDAAAYRRQTEGNFAVGRRNFSFAALRDKLVRLTEDEWN